MPTVDVILLGWNDAPSLPKVLQSLKEQTAEPQRIIYVDDDSTDDSREIAESFDVDVIIRLKRKKRVYGGFPILTENVNAGLREVKRDNPDFFMVAAGDVVLERCYIEKLLNRFELDEKLVIASGVIEGEHNVPTAPRGAGRMHCMSWWEKHIKWYPFGFLWESYAPYKAQSLGYRTRSFSDIRMVALRPTRPYKPIYGYAMRQLGYHPLYAILRCFMGFLYKPENGVTMLRTYRTKSDILEPIDPDLARWIKHEQMKHLLQYLSSPAMISQKLRNLRVRLGGFSG